MILLYTYAYLLPSLPHLINLHYVWRFISYQAVNTVRLETSLTCIWILQIVKCIWTFTIFIAYRASYRTIQMQTAFELLCRMLYTHWHWVKFKCILVSGSKWFSRYRDFLRARRSGDRIPVGARFSVRVHNGPEAHPASYTKSIGTSPAVKQPGRGVDYPSLSSAEAKERVKLYIYSPSETSWTFLGCILLLPF